MTLVVSLGPDIELVEVPTLVGEDVDNALALIAKAGLQNGSIRNDDSDLPKGTVTFQSIDGGQMVKKLWPVRSVSFARDSRVAAGHRVEIRYMAQLTV